MLQAGKLYNKNGQQKRKYKEDKKAFANYSSKSEPEKKYKDMLDYVSPEAYELLGFNEDDDSGDEHEYSDLDSYDYETVDDLDDVKVYSGKDKTKKKLSKEILDRKEEELERFKTDNSYDFEDFIFFKHDLPPFQEGDPLEFYITSSSWKYDKDLGTTIVFGGNMFGSNDSCTIGVHGFKPNFYIRNDFKWKDAEINSFLKTLENVVRTQYKWAKWNKSVIASLDKLYLNHEYVYAKELFEYQNNVKYEYIKINCSYPNAVAAARHVLNSPDKYNWFFKHQKFKVYEANIDVTMRYFYDTNTSPSAWFRIAAFKYNLIHPEWRSRSTTSVVEATCHYTDLKMIDVKQEPKYNNCPPNWSALSYDIEVCNKPFVFPLPMERPVIVISISAFRVKKPDEKKIILFVYAKDGLLPAELPKCDHFYWYSSEPGLLKGFRDFFLKVDPDFDFNYNGCGFDWPMIMDNGALYFGDNYLIWGRDRKKKTRYGAGTRSEWRGKTKYSVDIDQRVDWDMLKVVPAIPLPGKEFFDMSLASVSMTLLGRTKNEFNVDLMEQKWSNPNTLGELWDYAWIDAILPGDVAAAINSFWTFDAMSNMTNVTLQKIINRGAGCKIEGYLRKLCSRDNNDLILIETKPPSGKTNRDLVNKCAKQVDGACVLEAKTGFYVAPNYVFVLDFKSMYPSIIILLNLCLMTHLQKGWQDIFPGLKLEDYWILPNYGIEDDKIFINTNPLNPSFVTKAKLLGLLPKAEIELGEWRDRIKAQLKAVEKEIDEVNKKISELEKVAEDESDLGELAQLKDKLFKLLLIKTVLDGTQQAIKIIQNGIFGQTIFELSQFFMPDIGKTILTFGRFLLNYVRLYILNEFNFKNIDPETGKPKYNYELDIIYGVSHLY